MKALKTNPEIKALFEDNPGIVATGLFYGYPTCCIETFSNMEQFAVWEAFPHLPSTGTGYCPCMECAPKVQLNWPQFQQEHIQANRFCSSSFPQEEKNDKEFDLFFIHLSMKLGLDPVEMSSCFKGGKTIRALLKEMNSLEPEEKTQKRPKKSI